jgi:serine/threonine protein kinase
MYAIKAARREARGSSDRDRMLQEVYALAALTDDTTAAHMHIVGYHQAWMEGNRLYIQTELCDGSLEMEMKTKVMDEKRRYKLLREMALALDLVHRSGMIHLDIKVCVECSCSVWILYELLSLICSMLYRCSLRTFSSKTINTS